MINSISNYSLKSGGRATIPRRQAEDGCAVLAGHIQVAPGNPREPRVTRWTARDRGTASRRARMAAWSAMALAHCNPMSARNVTGPGNREVNGLTARTARRYVAARPLNCASAVGQCLYFEGIALSRWFFAEPVRTPRARRPFRTRFPSCARVESRDISFTPARASRRSALRLRIPSGIQAQPRRCDSNRERAQLSSAPALVRRVFKHSAMNTPMRGQRN